MRNEFKMSDRFNDIRENALATVLADVDKKIEEAISNFQESDVTDADIETVKLKYRNAFQNYVTTGFDIAFQTDVLDKLASELKDDSDIEIISDLNLSVTDDDLQKLDDANSRNAYFRKVYPAKCSLLLERALKIQVDSCNKLRANVHAVERIERDHHLEQETNTQTSAALFKLNEEKASLRSNIKDNFDKLRRLENAQKILLSNKQQ